VCYRLALLPHSQISLIVLLLPACLCCATAAARWALPLHTRSLKQQLASPCPPGCVTQVEPDGTQRCMLEGTADGYKCTKCKGQLLVNLVTGMCDCPRGYYGTLTVNFCESCDKGYYCPGGQYDGAPTNTAPVKMACPLKDVGMTTRGRRSINQNACGEPVGRVTLCQRWQMMVPAQSA
jgi:hypothetical protein